MSPHDKAFAAYLDTACWSSRVDDQNEIYANQLTDASVQKMREDWEDFFQCNAEDIRGRTRQAAHEFWLTRNGHGAGFWDGGWPKEVGDRLTKSARAYGEAHLWVDKDGNVHQY